MSESWLKYQSRSFPAPCRGEADVDMCQELLLLHEVRSINGHVTNVTEMFLQLSMSTRVGAGIFSLSFSLGKIFLAYSMYTGIGNPHR
eukprot:gene22589-biopygen17747